MNERIKELAEQADIVFGFDKNGDPEVICAVMDIEKFAELIIQKCMACSTWVGKNNTNTVEPMHTTHAINQRIKQQFGVEE